MRNTKRDYFMAVCLVLVAFICVYASIRNGLNWTILASVVYAVAGLSFCLVNMRKWRATFLEAAFGTMWLTGGYRRGHLHIDPLEMIAGTFIILLALINAYHVKKQGTDSVDVWRVAD